MKGSIEMADERINRNVLSNDPHKRYAKNGGSNAQIAVKREYVNSFIK